MSFVEVSPLQKTENFPLSTHVIGVTTCPTCGRKNIYVISHGGENGHARFHTLEDHSPLGRDELCPESGIYVPIILTATSATA